MATMAKEICRIFFPCFIPQDDSPSSGRGALSSGDGCSSSSSSSASSLDDLSQKLQRAHADKIANGEKVSLNLDELILILSELLERVKEKKKKQEMADSTLSRCLDLIKRFGAGAINLASALEDLFPVGLRVVMTIWEKWDDVSDNEGDCVRVLEVMKKLADAVKMLDERPHLRKEMSDIIKEATKMIEEQSRLCLSQMTNCNILKLVFASENQKRLLRLQAELSSLYTRLHLDLALNTNDAIRRRETPLPKRILPLYPEDAVGIIDPVEEVLGLLKCESEEKAVAVVLHGIGGMGKTTLANAVFARATIEGCKYSAVELFKEVRSIPNIVELQKCILRDLMNLREEDNRMPEILTPEDGREKIGKLLKNEVAVIYIDNVLREATDSGKYPLEMLLPWNVMKEAKKLRLLITTRNRDVTTHFKMEMFKYYPMTGLPDEEAMNLLRKELTYSDKQVDKGQLNLRELQEIVKISGGIPIVLNLLAGVIRAETDNQDGYDIVMEKKSKWNFGEDVDDDISGNLFAYDRIPKTQQESFLDICSFFTGWPWKEVKNIVGVSALNMLEKRSLVTRDTQTNTARVHDVILTIGRRKAKVNRFNLRGAREINKFLDRQKDIQEIRGLWFKENTYPLSITSTKLESMRNSLKILSLGKFVKVEGVSENIFEKLEFFEGEVPYLPFKISKSEKLRYLECQPLDLKFLTEMSSNLKHLRLDGKLHSNDAFEIFSSGVELHNLQTLGLINFAGLTQLPENLGNLLELTLSYCTSIKRLPGSFSMLRSLRIVNCPSLLKGLTKDFIMSLTSLQELKLLGANRKVLPEDFVSLTSSEEANVKLLLDKLIDLRSLNESEWRNVFNDLPDCKKVELGSVATHINKFVKTPRLEIWERFKYAEKIGEYLNPMNKQRDDISIKVIQGLLSQIL